MNISAKLINVNQSKRYINTIYRELGIASITLTWKVIWKESITHPQTILEFLVTQGCSGDSGGCSGEPKTSILRSMIQLVLTCPSSMKLWAGVYLERVDLLFLSHSLRWEILQAQVACVIINQVELRACLQCKNQQRTGHLAVLKIIWSRRNRIRNSQTRKLDR